MIILASLQEQAAAWDEFAVTYTEAETASELQYAPQVCQDLQKAGWLPDLPAEIVDLGGGSGRFALPLAHLGYRVNVVDFSRQMLRLLHNRLRKPCHQNVARHIQTTCSSWQDFCQQATPVDNLWLSMLPGLSSADLQKISKQVRQRLFVFRLVGVDDPYFAPLFKTWHLPPERPEADPVIMQDYQKALAPTHTVKQRNWTFTVTEKLTWPEVQAYLATIDNLNTSQQQQIYTQLQAQSPKTSQLVIPQQYQFSLLLAQTKHESY